jgi:hypothetical protein
VLDSELIEPGYPGGQLLAAGYTEVRRPGVRRVIKP